MALDFPPSPTVGQVFENWQWDGVKWIAAGATPQFPLAVGAGGTGATTPVAALANLGAMGTAGGTFSGPITLSGNATANFQPVALGQMNGALAGYLPLTGGTLTGALAGTSINLSGGLTGTTIDLSNGLSISGIGGVSVPNGTITSAVGTFVSGSLAGAQFFDASQGYFSQINNDLKTGNVYPLTDFSTYCGIPGFAWYQATSYLFTEASDPRLKEFIPPDPGDALTKVLAIPVHHFVFTKDTAKKPHTGFDASEVQAVFSDGVVVGEDEEKTLGVSLGDMLGLLWQAVQELNAKIGAS